YGASAVPAAWRRIVHGWPNGLRSDELVRQGVLAARADGGRSRRNGDLPERRDPATPDRREAGAPERRDPAVLDRRARKDRVATTWPTADHLAYATSGDISTLVRHPHDDGVWLGAVGILDDLPAEIDAVVSLCRVGRSQVPDRIRAENRVAVWLVDEVDPRANPNLTFVLEDTVDAIAALRAEGRTVFVHCVQAISRTPTVGALYAARHRGVPIEQALREVTDALPNANPNVTFLRELVPPPLPTPTTPLRTLPTPPTTLPFPGAGAVAGSLNGQP
ncbi:dual specificity protein phosphatase family protein, partial [Cryobacterium sp. TMT4-10]